MSEGGVRAEWLVQCDYCAVDVEPGRFYDLKVEALRVRNRAVRHEAWLLTTEGRLLCPECAAQPPPRTTRAERLTVSPATRC
jgi:hypothetical protein